MTEADSQQHLCLTLQKIEDDPDYLLDVYVDASDGGYAVSVTALLAPEDLDRFGASLQDFPGSTSHAVGLETVLDGKRQLQTGVISHEDWLHKAGTLSERTALRLRACFSDNTCAMEVASQNFADPPDQGMAHFFVPCEAAAVNRFGAALVAAVRDLKGDAAGASRSVELSTAH